MEKHMQESEIAQKIEAKKKSSSPEWQVKDFVASQKNGYWIISYTYLKQEGWELHIKRKGIKQFKTLNAVGECLMRVGVRNFQVVFE